MKLEKQCVSLELAKQLKSLGVPQESYFYWSNAMSLPEEKWRIENREFFAIDKRRDISAFTVAELGELLPIYYSTFFDGKNWCVDEEGCKLEDVFELLEAKTEADARAKILIHLIENKLMK